MIHYFKPYSLDGKLFEAYDKAASLVTNPNDWICFLDGDTMFLNKRWGHIIAAYVKKYPNTGIFTCYASRSAYKYLMPVGHISTATNLNYFIEECQILEQRHLKTLAVEKITQNLAGQLMLIKKSVWSQIRGSVEKRVLTKQKEILGVDTQITKAVLQRGREILLMKAVYLLHLFRLDGRKYEK